MKNKKAGIGTWIFWIILITLAGVGLYLEFKCGSGSGTLSDIPRYCWWLR